MSDSAQVRACYFGPGSDFKIRPVYNSDTSFYWKWPITCHVFVKWPVDQKELDHVELSS